MPPLPVRTNLRLVALTVVLVASALAFESVFGEEPASAPPTRRCIAPVVERHQASIDPGPTLAELRLQGPVFHTIAPGENLYIVGRRIGKTWGELNELNPHLNYMALERCSGKPAEYRQRPVSEGYYCNEHLTELGADRVNILGSHTLVPGDQIVLR